ncbi:MAG TPA: DUF1566 domain-containing protein [Burkholderiales bacterium]|nr:DUF1566 domain-containing protein [Burkholderiales bacterium]
MIEIVVLCGLASTPLSATRADCKETGPEATARFTAKAEEVYDKEANLTWQRCAVGQRWEQNSGCLGAPRKFTFEEAQALADQKWRVPTLDELTSIVADYCSEPAVDAQIFPNTASEQFWSNAFYSPMAFYVSFRNGSTNPTYYTDSRYNVRLVRTGK